MAHRIINILWAMYVTAVLFGGAYLIDEFLNVAPDTATMLLPILMFAVVAVVFGSRWLVAKLLHHE